MTKCILSVDIEDWYHISGLPNTPQLPEWDRFPSRIEANFRKLLDIFSTKKAKATCFFLGWVAEKYPHLVKEALQRGHEIASHGYSHKLAYEMSERDFLLDVRKAKDILEAISGVNVLGYRAPGFSVTEDTPWFFDKLIEAGYEYDSSVFPAPRVFGGIKTDKFAPHVIRRNSKEITEFPVTAIKILGKPYCCFGGGYLRLAPYFLIRRLSRDVLAQNRPVIFYIHPREIDPAQPRLKMSLHRKFNTYVNLNTTMSKITNICGHFDVTTFSDYIKAYPFNAQSEGI